MVIVCPGCKNQITLDEATVPVGAFKVRCTSCGRTITTNRKDETAASPPKPLAAAPQKAAANTTEKMKSAPATPESSSVPPSLQGFVNDQIAAAKKEILDAMQALFRGTSINSVGATGDLGYSKRALICCGDPSTADTLGNLVKAMGYDSQSCATAADSLKNLDILHGLVVIDPSFTDDLEGTKKIIGRINAKKGMDRRQVFVVLLSSTQKTMDGNSAFMSGVNLIVNKADLNSLESFIRQSQKDFQQMYHTFSSVAAES